MSNTNTAMTVNSSSGRLPHQHCDGDDQAGLVGQRHVAFADAELFAHLAAALRPDDLRLAPRIRHDTAVADPHAVREAGAHRLDDRLLRREAHRQETHRTGVAAERLELGGQQQTFHEPLAELLVHLADALQLHDVRADAEDHALALAARASIIRRFISDTARAMPSISERATMACPMFSSTISRIAAIGCTLW